MRFFIVLGTWWRSGSHNSWIMGLTLSAQFGIWINIALLIIGVFKFLATIVPLTLTNHFDKKICIISLIGSIFLMIYGGLNMIIGILKMCEVIENYNYFTTFGQAFVDPLFLFGESDML